MALGRHCTSEKYSLLGAERGGDNLGHILICLQFQRHFCGTVSPAFEDSSQVRWASAFSTLSLGLSLLSLGVRFYLFHCFQAYKTSLLLLSFLCFLSVYSSLVLADFRNKIKQCTDVLCRFKSYFYVRDCFGCMDVCAQQVCQAPLEVSDALGLGLEAFVNYPIGAV